MDIQFLYHIEDAHGNVVGRVCKSNSPTMNKSIIQHYKNPKAHAIYSYEMQVDCKRISIQLSKLGAAQGTIFVNVRALGIAKQPIAFTPSGLSKLNDALIKKIKAIYTLQITCYTHNKYGNVTGRKYEKITQEMIKSLMAEADRPHGRGTCEMEYGGKKVILSVTKEHTADVYKVTAFGKIVKVRHNVQEVAKAIKSVSDMLVSQRG